MEHIHQKVYSIVLIVQLVITVQMKEAILKFRVQLDFMDWRKDWQAVLNVLEVNFVILLAAPKRHAMRQRFTSDSRKNCFEIMVNWSR